MMTKEICPNCNGCGWENPAQAIDKCSTCNGSGVIATMKETLSNHRITVGLLGSGYAAVRLVDVTNENGTYTDVQQTGIGRYKKREEAVIEARMWSKADDIPFKDAAE